MEVLLPTAMVENTFKSWAAAWGKTLGAHNVSRNENFIQLRLWETGREYTISGNIGDDKRFLVPNSTLTVRVKGRIPGIKVVHTTAPKKLNNNESYKHVMQKVRNALSLLYKQGRSKSCKDSASAATNSQTSPREPSAQPAKEPSGPPSSPN